MQLICKHDPSDPSHLICETKHSPFCNWLKRRWRRFYCKGPSCPPHKAYTHLVLDILFLATIAGLAIANIFLLAYGRRIEEHKATLEEQLARVAVPVTEIAMISEEPEEEIEPFLSLEAEAFYFSKEGEQLGRGPWPPRLGEKTKLKVCLKPIVVGDFDYVIVSGRLAENVEWTGFAPIGRGLSYEPETRLVRFRMLEPENTQYTSPDSVLACSSAVFEVEFSPTFKQLQERQALITDSLVIYGRESSSGARREVLVPNIVIDY